MIGQAALERMAKNPEAKKLIDIAMSGKETVGVIESGNIVYESFYSPLKNKDGEVEGVIGVGFDNTERKKAENRIQNQNVLLENAVEAKQKEMELLMERLIRQEKLAAIGKISANIAHELRNPLSMIEQSIFFLNRLLEQNRLEFLGPKVKKHLDLIKKNIDDSERVISDLLQSTKIKPLEKEQANLGSIILEAIDRCQVEKNIKLNINLNPEPFLIWVDPFQIRQLVANLLNNSAQAISKQGIITITAKLDSRNKKYFFNIKDNGSGISSENLSKVFEPLFTSKSQGIGLGLSICKQIVENHGGTITMTSKTGKGTSVKIELPYETTSAK